jgi:hypothetical protein
MAGLRGGNVNAPHRPGAPGVKIMAYSPAVGKGATHAHGFGDDPYLVRPRWDYFIRYLLGAEPPAGRE